MRRIVLLAIPLILVLANCSLAGDITPPPALATAQAAQPVVQPTVEETLSPSPNAQFSTEPTSRQSPPAGTPEGLASGTIVGRVTNGTAGAQVPAGLVVELHGFDAQTEVVNLTTAIKSDASFEFSDLDVVPGRLFVVAAKHQGVMYGSEVAHLAGDGEALVLPLTIFDTTPDTASVQVDRLHLLFEFPSQDVLRILELWVISNVGDRTIATPQGEGVLQIALPDGARNLSFEGGELGGRFTASEHGFRDSLPLRPGDNSAQLIFSFDLPYQRGLDFSQPMDYPVAAVVVLTEEGAPSVSGQGLQDMGLRKAGDAVMRNYSGGNIAAGERLELRISGRPSSMTGGEGGNSTNHLVLGIGVFAMALVGVGAWWRWSGSRPKQPLAPRSSGGHPQPSESRPAPHGYQRLIQEMADLDEAFEAGEIPQGEYQPRRAELKRRALDLMGEGDD